MSSLRSRERILLPLFFRRVGSASTDPGCEVISGFGHHVEVTDVLASISCRYRSDAGQDEFRLVYCEFQKYEVMIISVVGG